MIDVSWRAHLQTVRYPFHRHRRLPPHPHRYGYLLHVALGSSSQFLIAPTPPLQFFGHDPFRVRLCGLLPLLNSRPASNLLHRDYRKGWSL